MPNLNYALLIPLLPLAGFLLMGLSGKDRFKKSGGIIATLFLAAAFILALFISYGYFFEYGKIDGIYRKIIVLPYTWLHFTDTLSIDMGLLLDPISVMMLLVITFISLMVHIYSLGYMKGDERFPVYFAFLGLFTFSMLGLVLSLNIFQMYIFWELVGVSSFLLIGYYYQKPSAVAASKKAFIITRFADLGFLLGILMVAYHFQSLDFMEMIQKLTAAPQSSPSLTYGLILIFAGAAGKSAMFPLHIWLPDAMEGPTPVSALIHAATMVVAGIFLVARIFPLVAVGAPSVLQLIAYTGAFSAVFAAVIACTQTDIKRVLAYSTMSQIGFMMFAIGVSGYGGEAGLGYLASMFHLFTHAIFKALLFLGAGAVIHYIHSNEIADMGGLRKKMPVTHMCFLVACLAIAGLPPFAGFFSKEEILLAAWQRFQAIYWVGLITSGLTAFYMFRLYFSVFWNDGLANQEEHHKQAHGEGGPAMMTPLVLLAVGATIAGFIPFGKFVSSDGTPLETHLDPLFSIAPVAVAILGISAAMWFYKNKSSRPAKIAALWGGLYRFAYHKFYIDEVYLFITKKIIFNCIGRPAAWFDRNVVDGLVNATGSVTENVSEKIKKIQSGKVQGYAIFFLFGAITIAILFIYLWK